MKALNKKIRQLKGETWKGSHFNLLNYLYDRQKDWRLEWYNQKNYQHLRLRCELFNARSASSYQTITACLDRLLSANDEGVNNKRIPVDDAAPLQHLG